MKNQDYLCGLECRFIKAKDLRTFMNAVQQSLSGYSVRVVDMLVFPQGKWPCLRELSENSNYLELFQGNTAIDCLVLHLYHGSVKTEIINTYQDFLKSDCEIIILVYDVYNLEIYCKKPSLAIHLLNTARIVSGTVVQEKYADTDTRTEMFV